MYSTYTYVCIHSLLNILHMNIYTYAVDTYTVRGDVDERDAGPPSCKATDKRGIMSSVILVICTYIIVEVVGQCVVM